MSGRRLFAWRLRGVGLWGCDSLAVWPRRVSLSILALRGWWASSEAMRLLYFNLVRQRVASAGAKPASRITAALGVVEYAGATALAAFAMLFSTFSTFRFVEIGLSSCVDEYHTSAPKSARLVEQALATVLSVL